jgi:hypothetical protein
MLCGFFTTRGLVVMTLALGGLIVALIGPGIWTRVTTGHVLVHWSRVVLAGLLGFTLAQICVTRLVVVIVRLHVARVRFSAQLAFTDKLRTVTARIAAVQVAGTAAEGSGQRAIQPAPQPEGVVLT